MKSILVLTCLCLIGATRVYGASKRVLDFLSYFNGYFDNDLQTKQCGDDHDFIQVTLIPVDIKCLLPNPVVLVEESVNNTAVLRVLAEVKDGIEDTVSLTMYNFGGSTKYKSVEYSLDNLSNISCGDLLRDDDCIASYRVASDGYVYGNFPSCGATVNGKHPRYSAIIKCASFSATAPLNGQLRSPVEPYESQLRSKKYPF